MSEKYSKTDKKVKNMSETKTKNKGKKTLKQILRKALADSIKENKKTYELLAQH